MIIFNFKSLTFFVKTSWRWTSWQITTLFNETVHEHHVLWWPLKVTDTHWIIENNLRFSNPEIPDFSLFPSDSIFTHGAQRKYPDHLFENCECVSRKGSRSWESVQRTSLDPRQRLASTKNIRSAVKKTLRKWRNNVWVTNTHTRRAESGCVTAEISVPSGPQRKESSASHNSVYVSASRALTLNVCYSLLLILHFRFLTLNLQHLWDTVCLTWVWLEMNHADRLCCLCKKLQ